MLSHPPLARLARAEVVRIRSEAYLAVAVLLDAVRAFDGERSTSTYSIIEREGMQAVELTDSLDNSFMLRAEDVSAVADRLEAGREVVLLDAPTPFSAALRPLIARATRYVIVVEPNLLGTAAASARRACSSPTSTPSNRSRPRR